MPSELTKKLAPADPNVLASAATAACACCGAVLPGGDDGCRAAFAEVLARGYSDRGFGAVHHFVVDAHALQHSEWHGPRSNAVHLVRLCWLFDHEEGAAIGTRGPLEVIAARGPLKDWPFLAPPERRGDVTVADLYAARDLEAHLACARRWAESAWAAWAEHHAWARSRLAAMMGQ